MIDEAIRLVQNRQRSQIAVIDDSQTVRKLFEMCLRREGYTVRSFANGVEALECYIAGEEAPQLVFLDVEMPRMDGYEVAQILSHRVGFERTAIVFVSQYSGRLQRLKGRLCGG